MVDVLARPASRTAAALRQATLDVHLLAEQNPFIADLMAGNLGIADLARLTGQLRSIYAAIESIVPPHRADPKLLALFDPRLDRLSTIDHDLERLGIASSSTASLIEPLPATQAYVDRIHAISSSAPRVVAHHYVRYLGDLSGGQIIAMLMRRHYGVTDDALTFYGFEGLGSKGGFKAAYRRALDALLHDQGTYDEVVDEARIAYEANRQMFIALDPRVA